MSWKTLRVNEAKAGGLRPFINQLCPAKAGLDSLTPALVLKIPMESDPSSYLVTLPLETRGARPQEIGRREDIGAAVGKWTGVATAKARIKEMIFMKNQDIGYHDVELFLGSMEMKTFSMGGQGKLERKVLRLIMNKKIKDEKKR